MMQEHSAADYTTQLCNQFSGTKPKYLIVGDSYAGDIYVALSSAYKGEVEFGHFVVPGCPISSPSTFSLTARSHCLKFYFHAFNEVIEQTKPDGIFLVSNWSSTPDTIIEEVVAYSKARAKSVYVVGMRPIFPDRVPNIVSQAKDIAAAARRINEIDDHQAQQRNDRLRALLTGTTSFVDIYSIVCPSECLITTEKGEHLYRDYTHFT